MRIVLTILVFLLFGCKTNQYKNKLKTGLWIYNYTVDSTDYYELKEKYRDGNPVKTWRKYKNNKIEQKEKYVGNICYITNYFENGKIESKGKVKLIDNAAETHWFYFGKWFYYDKFGILIRIANYENGIMISEEIQ